MPLDQLQPESALTASSRRQIYRSTKSYGHSEGLSCAFRQWRAIHSHCRLVHGYALAFKFTFVALELDEHNWCFDFGGLKPIKAWLHEMFDHKFLVAEDDPDIEKFRQLDEHGLIALRVVPAVGCEAVAHMVFEYVAQFVAQATNGRVWLELVEVSEHSGNSAIYGEEISSHRLVADPANPVNHPEAALS